MLDLHFHTYYSDGQCNPQEMIEPAARRGIRAWVITAHDNLREFKQAAQKPRQKE